MAIRFMAHSRILAREKIELLPVPRFWHEIAIDILQESDPNELMRLCHELNLALEKSGDRTQADLDWSL